MIEEEKMHAKYGIVFAALVLLVGSSHSQGIHTINFAELTSKGGVQIPKEELRALLLGAKVMNIAATGSTRAWTNNADGRFVASSDNRAGPSGRPTSANGTWEIGENGTYCVTLVFKSSTEQWCRYIFKVGEDFWGVKSLTDPASVATRFSFPIPIPIPKTEHIKHQKD